MFETVVTMVGLVAGEITKRRTGDNVPVMSFRLLTIERRHNRDTDQWTDGDRMFVSVHCRRDLGVNVAATLRRGDRVIVTGRLYHREFLTEGHRRFSVDLDARAVGPDLARCSATLNRDGTAKPRPSPAQPQLALAATAAPEGPARATPSGREPAQDPQSPADPLAASAVPPTLAEPARTPRNSPTTADLLSEHAPEESVTDQAAA
ncbi:MAG TPA: single-stranded DNA-binding protein [Actinokineospora sp.]|nr:single-stranded DNA-binding protein [Actinokineospora sp.]